MNLFWIKQIKTRFEKIGDKLSYAQLEMSALARKQTFMMKILVRKILETN